MCEEAGWKCVCDIGHRESAVKVFISMRYRQHYVCLCTCVYGIVCASVCVCVCGVYRQSVVYACVYAKTDNVCLLCSLTNYVFVFYTH